MKTRIILTLIVSIVTVASAFAQTRADARQKSQRERIHEGRQSGTVTRKEARLLNKQQRHIHGLEHKAKADGNLSARENAMLERRQDRANRNIYRAKHNKAERKN